MRIRTKVVPTDTPHTPRSRRAVRVPKPGTLAAFILAASPRTPDAEVARQARLAGFTDATPRKVYAKRWYYGQTDRPRIGTVPTAPAPAVPVAPAELGLKPIVNVHLPTRDHADLLRAIVAHGTTAARDMIALIEAHGEAVGNEPPARETA